MNGRMAVRLALLILIPLPLLSGCDSSPKGSSLPTFDDAQLSQGRDIWMQVCRNCHLTGVAGAPAVGNHVAWQQRLEKGKDTLYQSALNGIPGQNGWSMPPRGGMERLSDQQVQRAVDYMLAAQAELAQQQEP